MQSEPLVWPPGLAVGRVGPGYENDVGINYRGTLPLLQVSTRGWLWPVWSD